MHPPVPPKLKVETMQAYFDRAKALNYDPASLQTIGCILLARGCAMEKDTVLEARDQARHMLEGVDVLLNAHWDTLKNAPL